MKNQTLLLNLEQLWSDKYNFIDSKNIKNVVSSLISHLYRLS